MASKHSYKITLSNNKTEKEAIDYLLSVDRRFLLPTMEGRKQIVEAMGFDKKYSRTFDLFMLSGRTNCEQEITVDDLSKITLIELKTTQKYLPNNPKGFFFGVTQNEFDLATQLGDQYRFCFVSLHSDSLGYKLVTSAELENLIINKRLQYQINL
ncbi:MAG TPA: DUF3883 domain-containing protein [Candidatus Paceibacterota bacterium]|nr:DUF3883 domain-containing protein [Candidatus Paceibacterota bacterium]HMO82545.1 DUF3883 domain-containing protein [Candidatus Paceibacterota bacterium]